MITLYDLRRSQDESLINAIQAEFDTPVSLVKFDDQSIKSCIGCWSCWLKTPGECIMNDPMSAHYSNYINSDKVILLFDTAQGFIDHTAKAFLDRTIPHYHPYIEIVNQECHHVARYDRYPDMYFYFETDGLTHNEEQIIEDYLARTAFHFKSSGYRIINSTSSTDIKPLVSKKVTRQQVPFASAAPMDKLIIYNGSPRLSGSNSGIILQSVEDALPDQLEVRDLKQKENWQSWASSFPSEPNVLFFLPLYVHAMPSHLMNFLEMLHPSKGNIAFFIQSGFPESSQSHYLEAYFEQLSLRLDRLYLGTAIKGGVESLQTSSAKAQDNLIGLMSQTISHLVTTGRFEPADINRLAVPVQFGNAISTLVRVFGGKAINRFWENKLMANNAFDKRFDQPYLK